MKQDEPITSIMAKDIIAVNEEQKPSAARHLLLDNKIHHLPVVRDRKLVGLISSHDIMRAVLPSANKDDATADAIMDRQFSITDIMTKKLITISRSHTVRYAAQVLYKNGFNAVPVVDDDGNLEGIVTSTDMIRYLLQLYE
ncbi:MAG: CBS domain-containing protein [Elusimicrobiota bacterium]